MIFALAALNFALIALLVFVLRSHAAQDEQREAAWWLERSALLNRIQMPEAAPFMDDDEGDPQYVGFDDDDALRES